ncbi:hypothetical protein TWF481_011742 [Arthrobotrys musiformis]|uniref:Fungal N-terminal domain-containing protein n=1 Tax=Arthrobotrys musiformis TaxID=47236 RepID=A0AAV9W0K1_9PEZI
MDSLSARDSIIAVVQLSNAVLSYFYGFSLQAKEPDKDISEIISELGDFQDLLNQVHAALPEDDRAESAEIKGVYTALGTSNSLVEDISEKLAPLMKNGLKGLLKRPFEGKIIQLYFSVRQSELLNQQSNSISKVWDHADQAQRTKPARWFVHVNNVVLFKDWSVKVKAANGIFELWEWKIDSLDRGQTSRCRC